MRGASGLSGSNSRSAITIPSGAGSYAPRRFSNFGKDDFRQAWLALTGVSPTQINAPLPSRSKRHPTAASSACNCAQLDADRKIGPATSLAVRSALCTPVRVSMSMARWLIATFSRAREAGRALRNATRSAFCCVFCANCSASWRVLSSSSAACRCAFVASTASNSRRSRSCRRRSSLRSSVCRRLSAKSADQPASGTASPFSAR